MVEDRNSARHNMLNLMMQHEEFIVIGLTGRIGSGCSRVAKVLSSSFKDLNLPVITPGCQGLTDDTARDRRILRRYVSAHWVKFDIIRVRTAITSFLLSSGNMKSFLLYVIDNSKKPDLSKVYRELYEKLCEEFHITEEFKKEIAEARETDNNLEKKQYLIDSIKWLKENKINAGEYKNGESCTNINGLEYLKQIAKRYEDTNKRLDEEVSRYIGGLEDKLSLFSIRAASAYILQFEGMETLIERLQIVNKSLDYETEHNSRDQSACESNEENIGQLQGDHDTELQTYFEKYLLVHDILPALSNVLRDYVKKQGKSYTELFQKFGNYIRFYGEIPSTTLEKHKKSKNAKLNLRRGKSLNETKEEVKDIFALPRKINQFIKVLRHPFGKVACRPVRVVIDSIKNPFEAMYLRQRYSAFYLFAVSTNEQIRINRLLKERDKQMTMQKILIDGWAESANVGRKIYLDGKDFKLDEESDEKAFYDAVNTTEFPYKDEVRITAYETNQQQYYLQDVPASIEAADVFINNNYSSDAEIPNQELVWTLVRNISLIMFPGLLLPTPLERCMQIAFSAKGNSGCLSRQVGAVVTDKDYNILSVGWNDVPCGDISCARKNIIDLCKREDIQAYSDFELNDEKFRERLKRFDYKNSDLGKKLRGLPARYCFKDAHQDTKNPMRSRAMHAEEKALSACGDQAVGGSLFTTSSPCEMCSKSAKNHQIKNIYYVELYPGISESNYSHSGNMDNRATHHLFTGAVGRAYMQMYTPIMPQKDVLACLDIGWPWVNSKISDTDAKKVSMPNQTAGPNNKAAVTIPDTIHTSTGDNSTNKNG